MAFTICLPNNKLKTAFTAPTGMPDFLDKLHTAALRSRSLEVGVHDFAGSVKAPPPNPERLGGDKTHNLGGQGQIYA